jgi:hypothetical protein
VDEAGTVGLELSSQRADVDLDEVGVVCVIPPHLGQQLVLGKGLSAVTDEKCEQSKLGRGQCELSTGAGGKPVFLIDEQTPDLQDLGDRARRRRTARTRAISSSSANGFTR